MKIVANSVQVYWTALHSSCPLEGGCGEIEPVVWRAAATGADPIPLAWGPSGAVGLAVDDTDVYWADGIGAIRRTPKDGGASVSLIDGLTGPNYLAIDDTDVYWIDYNAAGVSAVPKAGGPPRVVATPEQRPVDLVIDGSSVYWITGGSPGYEDGTVGRANKAGGTPTVLATGAFYPIALAADATGVYWTNAVTDELMTVGIDGVGLRTVAALDPYGHSIFGLALDAADVYVTGTRLLRVSIADASFAVLATAPFIATLAVSDTRIYWSVESALYTMSK